jgi:alpha-L-fucosidase
VLTQAAARLFTFSPPPDARYTQRADRLYLHLFAWPLQHVHLAGLAGKVDYAQLLNDASEVGLISLPPGTHAGTIHPGGQPEGTLTLKLPVQRPDVAVPVVELFLKPQSWSPSVEE